MRLGFDVGLVLEDADHLLEDLCPHLRIVVQEQHVPIFSTMRQSPTRQSPAR
jgi:hypothetical protein